MSPPTNHSPAGRRLATDEGATWPARGRPGALHLAVGGAALLSVIAAPGLVWGLLLVVEDLQVRTEKLNGLGLFVGSVLAAMSAVALLTVTSGAVLLLRRRARSAAEPELLRGPARALTAGTWLLATPFVVVALLIAAAPAYDPAASVVADVLVPVGQMLLAAALPLATGIAASRVLTRR